VPFAPLDLHGRASRMCLGLTWRWPHDTWVRLLIWSGIGFAIYLGTGTQSKLRQR